MAAAPDNYSLIDLRRTPTMKNRPTFEDVLTPEFAGWLIRKLTCRTGTPLFDDDLAQEALLRGLLAFRRVPDVNHPRAFFAKIVRDTVIDRWRHKHFAEQPLTEDQGKVQPAVEHDIDRRRTLTRLGNALSLLSTHDREIVEMFYFQDASIAQVADEFKRSRSAVKMTLLRSRRTLQRLMNIKSV
jgi:RNA polymerase sigma factor (sigma-70 family)